MADEKKQQTMEMEDKEARKGTEDEEEFDPRSPGGSFSAPEGAVAGGGSGVEGGSTGEGGGASQSGGSGN